LVSLLYQHRKPITRGAEERCLSGYSAFLLRQSDSVTLKVAAGSCKPSSHKMGVSASFYTIGGINVRRVWTAPLRPLPKSTPPEREIDYSRVRTEREGYI